MSTETSIRITKRLVDGFRVWIGRNHFSNFTLSRLAKPGDIWLHAGDGIPGCHVLVPYDGRTIPENVIRTAAHYAIQYSKAQGLGPFQVIKCDGGDILAVRPDGTAYLEKWETLQVEREVVG